MKKWMILSLCLVLLATGTVAVSAQENSSYDTAADLLHAWNCRQHCCNETLPDYVSGFWLENGITYIGIVDDENKEAARQEILDLIDDDDSVVFTYQKYSFNYLNTLFESFHALFQEDIGLIMLDADEHYNRVHMSFSDKNLNDPDTQAVIAALTTRYGNAIFYDYVDPDSFRFVDSAGTQPSDQWSPPSISPSYMPPSMVRPSQEPPVPMFLLPAASVCILIILFAFVSKRKALLALRANNREVTTSRRPSVKEVKQQIKQMPPAVPSRLDDRVMASIDTHCK